MWDASHVLKTIFHIDHRAEIESGTIRHKFDQTGVGAYARRGIEKIKHISDAVNDLKVGIFAVTADVVGLFHTARFKHVLSSGT